MNTTVLGRKLRTFTVSHSTYDELYQVMRRQSAIGAFNEDEAKNGYTNFIITDPVTDNLITLVRATDDRPAEF